MSRVLVIAPHADDEVLGAGGTILKHVSNGDDVNVVIVTDRADLEKRQRQQSSQVSTELGVNKLYHLGLEDEHLDKEIKLIITSLEQTYNEVKPDIIYTCHSHDVNIDHQAVFKASTVVCRRLQQHPPSRFLSYEIPSSTEQGYTVPFVPNVYNVLTADEVEQKIDAFEIYTDEIRPMPNPRNADGLCNYACQRGMECGSMFAEAFLLLYERQ